MLPEKTCVEVRNMLEHTIIIIIMAPFVQKMQTCTYLEIHSSLVSKVGFVPSQSDDYVGAGLSLELLYPVLCSGESLLEFDTLISNIYIYF